MQSSLNGSHTPPPPWRGSSDDPVQFRFRRQWLGWKDYNWGGKERKDLESR